MAVGRNLALRITSEQNRLLLIAYNYSDLNVLDSGNWNEFQLVN